MVLEDGDVRVFYNAKAYRKEEDGEVEVFLKYVNGEKAEHRWIDELERAVKSIKIKERVYELI